MEAQPIRFCRPTGNVSGNKVKVRVNFEERTHPKYGNLPELTCDLDLFLPYGDYPISNYYSLEYSEQQLILEHFVLKYRSLHEDLDEEEVRHKFSGWLIITATIFPKLDVYSDIFRGVSSICAGSFQIDDTLDDLEVEEEIGAELDFSMKALYKGYGTWERIFAGEFEAWQDIARAQPIMADAIGLYVDAFHNFSGKVPNFRQNIIPFQRAVFRGSEGVSLSYGKGFSEEGLRTIREADAGGELFLEAAVALCGVHVPTHVRSSLIFKLFKKGYNLSSALLNDIFGLNKDLAKGCGATCNSILRKVERDCVSFQEAFAEKAILLRNALSDMRVTGNMLVETFTDDKGVQDYVRLAKETMDGQVYAYAMLLQRGTRYGHTKIEIFVESR